MHIESSKSNFQAQKGRIVTSVERTQVEHWQGQEAAVSFRGSAPSSFEGGGNMTPPQGKGELSFPLEVPTVSLGNLRCLCALHQAYWGNGSAAVVLGWICSLRKSLTASWTALFFLTWEQIKCTQSSASWLIVRFSAKNRFSTKYTSL